MGLNGRYGKHKKLSLPLRNLWSCLSDSMTEGDPEVWNFQFYNRKVQGKLR